MTNEIHIWNPMSVEDAAELVSDVNVPWWIVGGWAIDLFLGHQTRAHGDTDILFRRDDQLIVQTHLFSKGLLLYKTQQPGLKPWLLGEFLEKPVYDVWCRWSSDTPWVLQLMFLCTDGHQWVFKRDPSIRGAIAELGQVTASGIPYMRPHIQLLYKARRETRPKDQSDFDLAVPSMQPKELRWLFNHLSRQFEDDHPWIEKLNEILEQ